MGKGEGGWRDGKGRGKGQFYSSCSSCSSARSSSVQGFVCCLFCWRLRSGAGINGEGGRGQAGLGGRGKRQFYSSFNYYSCPSAPSFSV